MARLILEGNPVSSGIAEGPVIISKGTILNEKRNISEAEIVSELAAITAASNKVCASLKKKRREIKENLEDYRDMLDTQLELAADPKILDGARARVVKRKICATWALSETVEELINLFGNLPETCCKERAKDIKAIGECLLEALAEQNPPLPTGAILAVQELTPADLINLKNTGLKGIITVEGGATAHAIILAKSFKLPVVCGVNNLFSNLTGGEFVIIDGFQGKILVKPDKEEKDRYKEIKTHFLNLEEAIAAKSHLPAVSRDGKKITVLANIDTPEQSRQFKFCGAEGIGLFRTEFSYMNNSLPTENSLYKTYSGILNNIKNASVVFRTLDVGADKILSAQNRIHEDNPALGLRGIRFCLAYPEIFKTQLSALMRTAIRGNTSIMLPMLTNLQELLATKKIIKELQIQLTEAEIPHAENIPLGLMLETPAAALICGKMLEHCDFVSIGTNDLLHYLLAIDRSNRHVANLSDPFHPAFIQIVRDIISQAAKLNKPVSVCGELAADPYGIILLLGLGLERFSTSPAIVAPVKHFLSQIKYSDCEKLVAEYFNSFDPFPIRKKIRNLLDNIGFSSNPFLTLQPETAAN